MNDEIRNPIAPGLWTGQLLHFSCLIVLLIGVSIMWNSIGSPRTLEFWITFTVPVMHQLWVWIAWRLELKSSLISDSIGFAGYLTIFFILFTGRFLSLAWLAFLDRGSLGFLPTLIVPVTLVLVLPGLYAMFSVMRYFGMARAAGADHFDQSYREMTLVDEGIFRYTQNGMYIYAFLLFWAIAIGFNSSAAVIIAAFSHAYIWVHSYATEKPDMDYLYGS